MDFFANFLEILFFTLWFMIVIAFFVVVIRIIMDIFRDEDLSGWGKTGWLLLVVILPVIGSIIYLFARGSGMARRDARDAAAIRDAQREYTKGVVQEVGGPAGQIKAAKELLDAGTITQEEYEALKAKALS
ncbi:SHOCT domain-containing protein [Demequina activiva]|uniref:Membrane protein n=1 Tax=Demequina activiva TaxID=1582364 RepID=A0A919Q2F2_9MICO|nr:SHOCT domain-containing protein [Demequina activiva]GIG54017.1 membrane protein [Demequina activiva]